MNVDLAIVNARVVSGSGIIVTNLVIHEGKVVTLAPRLRDFQASEIIDASGMLILPGLVDAHVHFREPGASHKEGFETGTMAAAAGGVTSVLVMPTDEPPTLSVEDYERKIELGQGRSFVDFAILAGLGPDLSQIEPLARLGVLSVEIFLAGLNPELRITDNARLLAALELIAQHGLVAGITPGDDSIVQRQTDAVRATGDRGPMAFARSRPAVAEVFGVARACVAASESGARVHLRQISCRQSVELLRLYRPSAPRLSAEVLPHNLLLTEEALERHGPFAKMSPPLRTASDVQSMWSGLLEGVIDIVASDHAPHLREEKEKGRDDIWAAPLGIPGVQTTLPLLLNEVSKGRLTIEGLVGVACEKPARTFGVYPRKGALSPGSDADLVMIDPTKAMTIRNEDQFSKAEITPFHGTELVGTPVLTMVRGQVVIRSGEMTGPPRGALVTTRTHG